MLTLDFLTLIWGSKLGWVDIPSKSGGHWMAFSASWPEDKPLISRRIESCLEDQEDVYFSVSMFGEKGRRLKDTLSSQWLWADLDQVGPDDCAELGLAPTVCWESSPWRYQGLWRMDKALRPEVLARVNRALSYTLGADKGGWDLTQVLRPVGTRNWKYPGAPEVMEVYSDGPQYQVRELWRVVRGADPGAPRRPARQDVSHGRERSAVVGRISARARSLLATPAERVVTGERSSRLWELNCLLAEAGLAQDEIMELVAPCAWNKWGISNSGIRRLERDVGRAIDHVATKPPSSGNGHRPPTEAAATLVEKVHRVDDEELDELDLSEPSESAVAEDEARRVHLPFVGYSSFMAQNLEAPRWLIRDVWMAQSHGIIGGEAKSSKSLLSLAMGLSIASGCPFLGDERFAVSTPGPVLMIQEENTPWDVQDKLRKLARLYGLISKEDVERSAADEGSVARGIIRLGFPTDAPLLLLNNFGFDMGTEEYREALEETIRDTGSVMVILDPLYLMLGDADADKSKDVRPLQRWLLSLRYTYNVAVVLVHHFGKPRAENAGIRHGHRLLGSGTWYNWVDSALYAERRDPQGWFKKGGDTARKVNRQLKVEREWRSAAPAVPLDIRMSMGEPGDLRLRCEVGDYTASHVMEEMHRMIRGRGDEGILWTELADALGIDKRTVRKYAVGSGKIKVEGSKRGRGQSYRFYSATAD